MLAIGYMVAIQRQTTNNIVERDRFTSDVSKMAMIAGRPWTWPDRDRIRGTERV